MTNTVELQEWTTLHDSVKPGFEISKKKMILSCVCFLLGWTAWERKRPKDKTTRWTSPWSRNRWTPPPRVSHWAPQKRTQWCPASPSPARKRKSRRHSVCKQAARTGRCERRKPCLSVSWRPGFGPTGFRVSMWLDHRNACFDSWAEWNTHMGVLNERVFVVSFFLN